MKDELYKQYWDQWMKYNAQHNAIMEFIAEYGPSASLSEVLRTVSQKEAAAGNGIDEIDTERNTVLKEIAEKKGTDWVISQIAQGVSTSELIDIYKYEYNKYTLSDGRL